MATINSSRFQKGMIPWNKGLKKQLNTGRTHFKKGRIALNKENLGIIKIKGKQNIRRYIKIEEPDIWEKYARYLWRKKYGQIFKEDIIHHLDGDKLNDKINNLIALSRKDHPKFHNKKLISLTKEQIKFYKERYSESGRQYYSYYQFVEDIKNLTDKIKKQKQKKFDAIIAITRGGLIPALYLAQLLNIREIYTVSLQSYGEDRLRKKLYILTKLPKECSNKKVLLVDDFVESGTTIKVAMKMLQKQQCKYKTLTLFKKKWSPYTPDYYTHETSNWIDYFYEEL